ncbi:MAG: lipoate--protein ligase family protein [Calditrichaeota bacterium]|nr:MAG: lipoate--protein ligase family protein [Calditrichota bacterium]
MRLLLIDIPETNPEENLRIEKALAEIKDEYFIVRLWINSRCIILGKFQKHIYEINKTFLENQAIDYFYRTTGGGTVYQDEGNLNITFVKPLKSPMPGANGRKTSQVITDIIARTLTKDDFPFEVSERNAVYFEGKKLLGSAVSMTQGKFLYHACLLVHANLEDLRNSLNWQPNYPDEDKKLVKSHRDPVINLNDIYPVTIEHIKHRFTVEIKKLLQPQQILHIRNYNEFKDFSKQENHV